MQHYTLPVQRGEHSRVSASGLVRRSGLQLVTHPAEQSE